MTAIPERSIRVRVVTAAAVVAAAAAVLTAAAGCAEERAPINRVQANALAKSFFVGPDLGDPGDDPEFYKRGTVVDVVYGAGQEGLFTSTYAQPVSRVRWEITEETLNARLSYEIITGTDGKGNRYDGVEPKASNDGQIVASYRITSHFDIRRDYNPQTGEALNIVVENTTDRPWYARDHFRVDWSKNLVSDAYDYDTLSLLGVIGAVEYEPFAYTVLDPASPDAPHFDAAAGYFDVTNKAYAKPREVDLAGLGLGAGTIPACFLSGAFVQGGTAPWANCNPVELTIRESFRRVTDTDYEPMDHDGVRFQTLGAFNFSYRRGYARSYGLLDREWSRFISRYNIWKRSHAYADPASMTGPVPCATPATTEDPTGDPGADPNRDSDQDGTADECHVVGRGSRCDLYTRKCTLPYRDREVAVIPWHIAGDTSLFDPTNWAVLEWDLAMKTAVQTARLVECRRTGESGCEAKYPMWTGQQDDNDEAVSISRQVDDCRRRRGWDAAECGELARARAALLADERGHAGDPGTLAIGAVVAMPPVIVLCHNPVVAGDHTACGPKDLAPRLGDIRYNLVLNIESPQVPSPWGILADADDPVTGEKVAGSMNIWTHVTDLAAQQLVDMVRYVNGEIPTAEVTNGSYIQDWPAAARLGGAGGLPTLPRAEIVRRLAGASRLDPRSFEALAAAPMDPEIRAVLDVGKAEALDVRARNDVPSPGQVKLRATLERARGTAVEAALVNPAMLQLAGGPAGAAPGAGAGAGADQPGAAGRAVPDRLSPLALNNPLGWTRLQAMRENALAARGACVLEAAPEPTAMTGLADILARKFPPSADETASDRAKRHARMFQYIRRRYHYAIIAHEMGHSVGLRHNFVSSAAPLFYRPQYWQLRTRNGQVQSECTDAVEDGASCVGPRYWDPVTAEEQSQLVWMWMHSSVMDYAGDVSQDLIGLGATDFAAARFFYGDTVSVYTDPGYQAGTPIGTGITLSTDTFGGLLGIRYGLRAPDSDGVDDIHYSALQKSYGVIKDCVPVYARPPEDWNGAEDGVWDEVLDGHVVAIGGEYSKCRQQPVDYLGFTQLRMPTDGETNRGYYRGGPSVDPATRRLRVPYAFASDNWADLGNVSVFRHDNGGDPYEQAQFLIATQESRHIFDNYRRGRSTFSLPAAVQRSFGRYGVKLQGIAGGMGFLASIYEDLGTHQGYSFPTLWPLVVGTQAHDNMIAATVVFDHFVRNLSRPEPGPHYRLSGAFQDPVLRSANDPDDFGPGAGSTLGQTQLIIPNGITGFLRDVGFGGHTLENELSAANGDFNVEYVQNAGSYYGKIYTAFLLAESEDRFISQSRRDFYDARFRAVGLADVLPDGFRRVIANALTGDRSILAPRLEADAAGLPVLDTSAPDAMARRFPRRPLGWVSFWPSTGPEICFSTEGRNACTNYAGDGGFAPAAPQYTAAVDPQIGWEVQKFLMAWTVALIKANERTEWMDMMRIWRLGQNASPEIDRRIEWQDPVSGELYYARDFGTECLFGDAAGGCAGGKLVQRGIAARVLEYANALTAKGYKLDVAGYPGTAERPPGFNAYGRAMVVRHPNGQAVVRQDPAVRDITPAGTLRPTVECDQNLNPTCTPLTVEQNHFAHELAAYKSVPDYLWQTEQVYGWFDAPGQRGIY
jgi:hypothetical protein